LSDDESEMDIGEYTRPSMELPKIQFDTPHLHAPSPAKAAPSPMRPAPSPALATIVGTSLHASSETPVLSEVRNRTAEEIVKEIETLASSPLPPLSPLPARVELSPIPKTDDEAFLSDAAESGTDGDVLSDASDSDDDTPRDRYAAWASVNVTDEEKARVRTEKMFTIEEDVEVTVSQKYVSENELKEEREIAKLKYTTDYALKLVKEQIENNDFEQVMVNPGEGINISVEFTGKPAPHATWVREDGLPKEALVKNTEESTTLTIENASKDHEGVYGLLLQNEYGAQAAAFKVCSV